MGFRPASKLYSGLALVVGFALGLGWWMLQGQALVAESRLPEGLSAEDAAAVVERVAASPEEIVLASTLEAAGGQQGILPEGAVVEPRVDTFQRKGDLAEMLVDVRLPDGSIDTFAAVLVNVDGTWYLAYTVRGGAP